MISFTALFALGDIVNLGDGITACVEEVIFRRNCIQPLYNVSYWHEAEQRFITVPEPDLYTK